MTDTLRSLTKKATFFSLSVAAFTQREVSRRLNVRLPLPLEDWSGGGGRLGSTRQEKGTDERDI